jgi:hypothetical protein
MPRGGKRSGTPGKAYGNRTDLMDQRAPQSGTATAASAGQVAPASSARQPGPPPGPSPLTPDTTPFPTDPTAFPSEPLTAQPAFLTPPPSDPATLLVRSLMLHSPNPDLRRLLARLENR